MNTPRNLTLIAAAGATLIALAGCTSGDETEPGGHSAPAPVEDTMTTAPVQDPEDVVRDFLGELEDDAQHITNVDVPEPGRLDITTDLTDPGRPTAPDSLLAMSLCEAGARTEGVEFVTVRESDGTVWVLAGHPAYGPDCVIP